MRLTWTYRLDTGERIVTVKIGREELGSRNRVLIASRLEYSTGFVYAVNTDFNRHYKAELPAQLAIFNVDNVKELYRYILELTYSLVSGIPVNVESTVDVKVFGK